MKNSAFSQHDVSYGACAKCGRCAPLRQTWKVLAVDNDPDTHAADRLALNGALFSNRSVELLTALSPAEALVILRKTPDIAVMLTAVSILDNDDGLRLVHNLRRDLGRTDMRVIMRGGTPVTEAQRQAAGDYDISDWREPASFAFGGLSAALRGALSAYQDRATITALPHSIACAASVLPGAHSEGMGAATPAESLLQRLSAIFRLNPDESPCPAPCGLVLEPTGASHVVTATSGFYDHLLGCRLDQVPDENVTALLKQSWSSDRIIATPTGVAFSIAAGEADELTVYMPVSLRRDGPTVALLSLIRRVETTAALNRASARRLARESRLHRLAKQQVAELIRLPESDPHPVIQINQHDGTVMYANPSAQRLGADWRCAPGVAAPSYWIAMLSNVTAASHPVWLPLSQGQQDYEVLVTPNPHGDYLNLYFHNVTSARQAERNAAYLTSHDLLTGLGNRNEFLRVLDSYCALLGENNKGFTLLSLDLDAFSHLNEQQGLAAGDNVLRVTAQRLKALLRSQDHVFRTGDDSFAIIIPDMTNAADASGVAERISASLAHPFSLEGKMINVTASIGAALAPRDGEDSNQLIRNVEMTLQAARAVAYGRACLYTAAQTQEADNRRLIEFDISRGMASDEFELFHQPQVRIRDGGPCGTEVSLRWRHPQKGLLDPDSFVAAAERTGQINQLGGWAIDQACRQLAKWRRGPLGRLQMAINLSAMQLRDHTLPDLVRAALCRHRIRPGRLKLEVTESVAMNDVESTISVLRELRELGIELSIDGFGAGYSSLSHLRRLPICELKIHGSFIADIDNNAGSRTVVQTIISLGRSLGMIVVAEGVERPAQARLLNDMRCDIGQGFLYGAPVAVNEFEALFDSHPRLVNRA